MRVTGVRPAHLANSPSFSRRGHRRGRVGPPCCNAALTAATFSGLIDLGDRGTLYAGPRFVSLPDNKRSMIVCWSLNVAEPASVSALLLLLAWNSKEHVNITDKTHMAAYSPPRPPVQANRMCTTCGSLMTTPTVGLKR